MWGDAEGAANLLPSHPLSVLLFETSGPAKLLLQDSRWRDLLLQYNILVHLDPSGNSIVKESCLAMGRHSFRTGNLAALSIHVGRMLQEVEVLGRSEERSSVEAVEGKMRATCGALNLLRIMSHEAIRVCCDSSIKLSLKEAFTYRDEPSHSPRDAAAELVSALLPFVSVVDPSSVRYDATVLGLSLLLTLLSTQLYRPMVSSLQRRQEHYFLDLIVRTASNVSSGAPSPHEDLAYRFTNSVISWLLHRPTPPPRSIAARHVSLFRSVVESEKRGSDGYFENPLVVSATINTRAIMGRDPKRMEGRHLGDGTLIASAISNQMMGASKGVWKLSSALILFPFRLVRLIGSFLRKTAYSTRELTHHGKETCPSHSGDVLWITDSPIVDLGTSILLLLLHNHCHDHEHSHINPFRNLWNQMHDARWEDNSKEGNHNLMVNFESLFRSLGSTMHNPLGELTLYSCLQYSPNFSSSIAARTDLDTLLTPLLRTLYISSTPGTPISSSRLYIVIILLLLFSQDSGFGRDAFRRNILKEVPWYKERKLTDISLGSLIILCTLRCITWNWLTDAFLAGYANAVLLNLGPHICNLHPYAAMRMANVTAKCTKRYANMLQQENREGEREKIRLESLHISGEVCQTFLQLLRQCLRPEQIEHNLHLVYSLLYLQRDFTDISISQVDIFSSDLQQIATIISTTESFLRKDGQEPSTLSAVQAMELLKKYCSELEQTLLERLPAQSKDSDDFAFSYEEDADPEVFFIPYLWQVVVTTVTSGYVEWNRETVRVFKEGKEGTEKITIDAASFAKDVSDVV